ncbi:hypothetical protein [Streptomyces sp. NPDC018055]|uniref:hypothetical protein n=1 Tax=Streptomyces sp. NPDC018055 TaxID=3365038 RepID=UPI0037B40588
MDIGRELAAIKKQIQELQRSARLSSAALDSTALEVRDDSGSLRGLVGQQGDGTTAINIVNGPTPPAPNAPTVEPALAALTVTWDGTFADAVAAPLDWMRCEVHVGATSDFTPSQGTLRDTIETPQGGMVTIPLPYTEWYVKLRSRTSSGAVSTSTSAVAGTPRKAETADLTAGIITADLIAVDALTGKIITGGTINGAEFHSDDGAGGLVDIENGTVTATAASGWKIEIDPSQDHPTIIWKDETGALAGEINGLGTSTRPGLVISSGRFTDIGQTDWRWVTSIGSNLDGTDGWRTGRVREADTNISHGGYIGLATGHAQLSVRDSTDPGNNPIFQVSKGLFTFDLGRALINPPASPNSAIFITAKAEHTGRLIRAQVNGVDQFAVTAAGAVGCVGTMTAGAFSTIGAITAGAVSATGAIGAGGALTGDSLAVATTAFTTYTPTVTGGGSATYTSRTGWYYKLGKMVYFTAEFTVNAAGSGTTTVTITAPSNIHRTSTRQAFSAHAHGIYVSGLLANGLALALESGSGNVIDRISVSNNSATNRDNILQGVQLLAGATVTVQGWYREA